MKLQFKLALYNALTKIAIIFFTGVLILFSLENISVRHISMRLIAEKNQFLKNLSVNEINELLKEQKSFTDYTILKEEYIFLKPVAFEPSITPHDEFSTEQRTLEKSKEEFRILTYKFNFNAHTYLLEIGNSMEAVDDLKETIRGFTLFILIIALTLTLLIDLTFTKYLLAPLYSIIDRKLIRVNDPLHFDYARIATSTQDFILLDNSISTLMKKIADLFLLEKQFIANVSHELLTPISIISTRLENLMVHEQLSEESENKVFASLKTLTRLKAIINSLLLISKVENNQFDKNDNIRPSEVIDEIYRELEYRIADKQLTFTNAAKREHIISGNRSLMHTLLFNIINNAIKYNYAGGSIAVTDSFNHKVYQLSITDTGAGMTHEQIEKAYNRFEKLDTDERESFGLGLAIVKSIATFHHIQVSIQSEKNEGTAFKLTFLL